jgi:hypothetical protein
MFRNGGLQKRAVVLDGARRLVDLIVQLFKIVIRGGIRWAIALHQRFSPSQPDQL